MTPQEAHWSYSFFSTIVLLADLLIRIGLSLRVIMRKRPYGISLAWLIVILLVPILGGFFYLLFGENRLPEKRIARTKKSLPIYSRWIESLYQRNQLEQQKLPSSSLALHSHAIRLIGIPALAGNSLTIITNPEEILGTIIETIDKAVSSCHLQFYIWESGGRVNRVIAAMLRATARGVTCRILLDSIGSRDFLRSPSARKLKKAGIEIVETLPAGIINVLFSRIDIRNHRKMVVIDGEIAITGSMNMVDPDVFRKDAGVGYWIDMMVKIKGPAVETLAATFMSDWYLEMGDDTISSYDLSMDSGRLRKAADIHAPTPAGKSAVQLIPSGPANVPDAIHSLLLTTIYSAREELILTSPYFIPDESLLNALKAAAHRGVAVKIIIPGQSDSKLSHYAGRARFEELVEAGISIFLFGGGLLHSKTISVDRTYSLFGSVNMDMRSFWLNFEVTLAVYCRQFTADLRKIQQDYLEKSSELDIRTFKKRGRLEKFKENCVLLIAPLL